MAKYPHLTSNESNFPNVSNVDVYKYDNDFDYSRFDYSQMEITLTSVPWDMGEARVGNRAIEGIGNVVHFGTKAKRDKYFDDLTENECFRFETKYKALHRDLEIDVPLPFDVAARYNYVAVKYSLFANDNSPIQYESSEGVKRWFWFAREVEFISANTTRLHLQPDSWTTWIYDLQFNNVILEQGHAPMFETDADTYLSNPLTHCENLLTTDFETAYAASVVRHQSRVLFNSTNVYAVIISSGDFFATWGNKTEETWHVAADSQSAVQGSIPYNAIAVEYSKFESLMAVLVSSTPQFLQTIKGVFFVSQSLLSLSNPRIILGSIYVYHVDADEEDYSLYTPKKSDFGYGAKYEKIAKLYTYPYAHYRIYNTDNEFFDVKIEDTQGELTCKATINLAFPWINIKTHINGIGAGNALSSISFTTLDSHSLNYQGNWIETLRMLSVPVFGIVQSASDNNDFAEYFDRKQAVNDYTTDYNNAVLLAATDYGNATLANGTDYDNAIRVEQGNMGNLSDTITCLSDKTDANNKFSRATRDSNTKKTYNDVIEDEQLASVVQAETNEYTAASAIANGVGSVASGAIGGAGSGGAAGAGIGAAVGVVGAATSIFSTSMLVSEKVAIFNANLNNMTNKEVNARTNIQELTSAQIINTNEMYNAESNYQQAIVGRFSGANGVNRSNAADLKSTRNSNALDTYDTSLDVAENIENNAIAAIDNRVKSIALRAPLEYGEFMAGEKASTVPLGLFCEVKTQSAGAIKQAGDEFLKHGYMLGAYWPFDGNFNLGKYFTYWRFRDFQVKGPTIPDKYMDEIRFYLFGGVTVWANPDDIGEYSIYQNWPD